MNKKNLFLGMLAVYLTTNTIYAIRLIREHNYKSEIAKARQAEFDLEMRAIELTSSQLTSRAVAGEFLNTPSYEYEKIWEETLQFNRIALHEK